MLPPPAFSLNAMHGDARGHWWQRLGQRVLLSVFRDPNMAGAGVGAAPGGGGTGLGAEPPWGLGPVPLHSSLLSEISWVFVPLKKMRGLSLFKKLFFFCPWPIFSPYHFGLPQPFAYNVLIMI